jgi:hypothetical protein
VCAYAGEVLAVLEAALGDAYHEVNLEACSCVHALVGELGRWLMRYKRRCGRQTEGSVVGCGLNAL